MKFIKESVVTYENAEQFPPINPILTTRYDIIDL